MKSHYQAVVIGGGVVGANACKIAVGIGADVTLLDIDNVPLARFGAVE